MKQSRALIDSIVKENKVRSENKERQLLTPLLGKPCLLIEIVNLYLCRQVVYGITTGFGKFARTVIEKDKLSELQVKTMIFDSSSVFLHFQANLIRSHAAGVGRALSPENTRCRQNFFVKMIHDDIFNQDAACFAHQRACKRLLRHLCQNSQVRIIQEAAQGKKYDFH